MGRQNEEGLGRVGKAKRGREEEPGEKERRDPYERLVEWTHGLQVSSSCFCVCRERYASKVVDNCRCAFFLSHNI